MAGEGTGVFAALVDIKEGSLANSTINITELAVEGDKEWAGSPFLSSVSDSRAMLYFAWQDSIWYCDVMNFNVIMKKLVTRMPPDGGFCTLPLRLPNGKLVVAGAWPPSRDITLITCDEEPKFETIGKIPGERRHATSTALIGERFVVGFGGNCNHYLDDLWIFDVTAGKGWPVMKRAAWHESGILVPLVVQNNTLYLLGEWTTALIHSIPLHTLFESIWDMILREAPQFLLSFEHKQYPTTRQKEDVEVGVCRVRGEFPHYFSYNTINHQERMIHFSQRQGVLLVTELFLGPWAGRKTVNTGVDCGTREDWQISCCSFGDKILVMAGERNAMDIFCAVVTIDPGELTEESVHLEEKHVKGWRKYESAPFLAQTSENKVWIFSHESNRIWIGEIQGNEVVAKKHPGYFVTRDYLDVPALRLPDGRLVTAGGNSDPMLTTVTLTPGKRFSFETVGDIPGESRCCVSTILVKERFVLGFGGQNDNDMDDMWIFDLDTREASPVTKEGKWHPQTCLPFLAIKDGIFYIIGGAGHTVGHSISFQYLSELIQELGFQQRFQTALGLELRQHPASAREVSKSCGMHDLRECFSRYELLNTVDHRGRLLHFSHHQEKLCVTEVLFEPWLKTRTVNTGVECRADAGKQVSCCSFGDKIFVMVEEHNTDVFCALVSIDSGELTCESIHLEKKLVTGWATFWACPYLVQLTENKVWASFYGSSEIWIGEIKGETLVLTKHPDHLPMAKGFSALPLPLSDGTFLVAGGWPSSTNITIITPGEQFSFEKIGDMPGKGRDGVSTILIGERFVVGFGGSSQKPADDMWIFDLKTHRASPVKKEGKWHPGGSSPVLMVRDERLYVIGGWSTHSAHCISFTSLSRLIKHNDVKSAFCFCLKGCRWPTEDSEKYHHRVGHIASVIIPP